MIYVYIEKDIDWFEVHKDHGIGEIAVASWQKIGILRMLYEFE